MGVGGDGADQFTVGKRSGRLRPPAKDPRKKAVKYSAEVIGFVFILLVLCTAKYDIF